MTAHMASNAAARITSRREFLERAAAFTGAALLSPSLLPAAETPPARTAVDQVTLGATGIKLSRLGFGTGSNSGNVQKALGQQAFNGSFIMRMIGASPTSTAPRATPPSHGLPVRPRGCREKSSFSNPRFPASRRTCSK